MLEIRSPLESDRPWILDLLTRHWASSDVVTRGRKHDASQLPALLARVDTVRVGLLTYRLDDTDRGCEIVSLNSERERQGIGTALVEACIGRATRERRQRIWLVTTNDNLSALRFWQKRGFSLVAVHRNAIEESRRIKPAIPAIGEGGIPIRDEIELELDLSSA